jgi:hypothetical protein
LQGCLLVLVVLPVVAEDGQRVGDALSWVLHLELDRVLAVVHLLVILVHLNHQDALLGVWLLRIDRKDHIIGYEGFFRLLTGFVKDA